MSTERQGVWQCLNMASELLAVVESCECDLKAAEELCEFKENVASARKVLVPFLWATVVQVSFDVCIQGILDVLSCCHSSLSAFEAVILENAKDGDELTLLEPPSRAFDPPAAAATRASTSFLTGDGSSAATAAADEDGLIAPELVVAKASARERALVQLYTADFLLSQRINQFAALFPTRNSHAKKSAELIADVQGRALWSTGFHNKLMVPWDDFVSRLESYLNVSLDDHVEALKYYLDFARDGYVTAYELGIFLKWFGPLVNSVQKLTETIKGGYMAGFIPARHASLLLSGRSAGTFLVRFSKTHADAFALTFLGARGRLKHCLLYAAEPSGVTLRQPPKVYPSLQDFVKSNASRLAFPLKYSPLQRSHILPPTTVSPQDLRLSRKRTLISDGEKGEDASGSSAKDESEKAKRLPDPSMICVICMDSPRDTVFLECRHMVCCNECAPRIKDCPMCREPIREVLRIFRP